MLARYFLFCWCVLVPFDSIQSKAGKSLCPYGFKLVNETCVDIDECETNKHIDKNACPGEDTYCVNFSPGFRCLSIECPIGYARNSSTQRVCGKVSDTQGINQYIFDHIILSEEEADSRKIIYSIKRTNEDSYMHLFNMMFEAHTSSENSSNIPFSLDNFHLNPIQGNETDALIEISGPIKGYSEGYLTIDLSYLIEGQHLLISKYIIHVFVEDSKGEHASEHTDFVLDPQFQTIKNKIKAVTDKVVRKISNSENTLLGFLTNQYFIILNQTSNQHTDSILTALNENFLRHNKNNAVQVKKFLRKATSNSDKTLDRSLSYLDKISGEYLHNLNVTAQHMSEKLVNLINQTIGVNNNTNGFETFNLDSMEKTAKVWNSINETFETIMREFNNVTTKIE